MPSVDMECASSMGQESNDATQKGVKIKLETEECALGTEQRSNDAAVKDAQIKLELEECAESMGQTWQDHQPNVPHRLVPPERAVVVAKCLRRRGSRPRCRNKKEGRRRRRKVIGKSTRRSVPLMGVQSMLRMELECA